MITNSGISGRRQVAGEYREDKKSFVDSRDGDNFSLSMRTALAPAERVPYRFEHALVCLTNDGEIRFTTEDPEVAVQHTTGNILVLPAGVALYTDYLAPTADHPLECLTLELDRQLLDTVLDDFPVRWPDAESVAPLYSVDDVSEFVNGAASAAVRRLHRLLAGTEPIAGRERLIDLANRELVVLLLQSQARAALIAPGPAAGGRIARLLEHIRANLRGDLSVESLARVCHMSVSSLHAHCRASFGATPAALVRDCRLAHGRALLERADLPIKTIALESGFRSAVHFSQAFRAWSGETPSAYRRRRGVPLEPPG